MVKLDNFYTLICSVSRFENIFILISNKIEKKSRQKFFVLNNAHYNDIIRHNAIASSIEVPSRDTYRLYISCNTSFLSIMVKCID